MSGKGPATAVDGLQPQPKKKKRNYANAYTRKGEGLAAAIQSVTPKAEVVIKQEVSSADGKKGAKRRRSKAENPETSEPNVKPVSPGS